MKEVKSIDSYKPYWAHRFGRAGFLPMSKSEMDDLGWDSCDIIIVTGDAYVDHPSFGMAVIGRILESSGFRVGIISQPRWEDDTDFKILGKPNLFFGVTAGNMDSMVNRYTADRKLRSDDAYSPGGIGGKRPDRSTLVYTQRCKQAYKKTPVIIGGIEASLRRLAHYDYWSDTVRRSILLDSKADILLYGNAERALLEVAHRIGKGEPVSEITDVRGTVWSSTISNIEQHAKLNEFTVLDKSELDDSVKFVAKIKPKPKLIERKKVVALPSFEKVKEDKKLYAHASRVFHHHTNPYNASPIIQEHDTRGIWMNPPPIPLSTKEMDVVFGLEYQRVPHPKYAGKKIPAYDMIKFSINIMRGCFGGCTFCSITEHEGRIIQNRSEESVINEIKDIQEKVPDFKGYISDLGGPTANMYRLHCDDPKVEASCKRLSCVAPTICKHMLTSHSSLTKLYKKAREVDGIKQVNIASGLRYDLAARDPEYVRALVKHHVGGYLKIAPEHTENEVLDLMLKPEIGAYDKFNKMFKQISKEAGKEQYLIPYFIAAHPGSSEKSMMNLALWLKKNKFKLDQVQTFIPTPMAIASAMYHSGYNPLKKVTGNSKAMYVPKNLSERRVQKAFLRYHDSNNASMLRSSLKKMGREDLIGLKKDQLIFPEKHGFWQNKDGSKNKKSRAGWGGKDIKSRRQKFKSTKK